MHLVLHLFTPSREWGEFIVTVHSLNSCMFLCNTGSFFLSGGHSVYHRPESVWPQSESRLFLFSSLSLSLSLSLFYCLFSLVLPDLGDLLTLIRLSPPWEYHFEHGSTN